MPKYKMEEAQRAHRQEKLERKRKVDTRHISVSFLIVCEGTRTEPNYFEALIKDRFSDVREVKIEGEGRGTTSLIKQTMTIRDKSGKEFDRVWAVFDKDSFNDFNDAIKLAQMNNINCAWSNESFELWYYLHFQYLDTGVSRSQYISMIEREIQNKTKDSSYRYAKKDQQTYALLQTHGDEALAIRHGKRLHASHEGTDYANQKPCTTVYMLVEELNNPAALL